jgi:hypothetical protein
VLQQHVNCFFGFSKPGYKPDARYYNLQLTDICSFLRTGRVIHGEWFVNGQRIAGGDHRQPLPEGMVERPSMPADFEEMKEMMSIVDGCRSQFMCGTEFHQVSAWRAKTSVVRTQHTLVEKHGKNVCDGASNIPKHILESAVKNHAEIPPGPREAVVFMAKSHPTPTIAKSKKSEWWAMNRIFYGYYEHDLFTNEHIPEATGFAGSSKCHHFVGLSSDRGILDGKVPILAREDFCYCGACRKHDYLNCDFKRHGAMRRHTTEVARVTTSIVRTQMQALEEWAEVIGNEQLIAVRVDRTESQDAFYLAKPTGSAFPVPEATVHSTDQFEAGWLVVPIKWYDLTAETTRSYKLKNPPHLLLVSTTVRLSNLKFSSSTGNKNILSADVHQRIVDNL